MNRQWVSGDFVRYRYADQEHLKRTSLIPRTGDLHLQRGEIGQVSDWSQTLWRLLLLPEASAQLSVNQTVADPLFDLRSFTSYKQQKSIDEARNSDGIPHLNLGISSRCRSPSPGSRTARHRRRAVRRGRVDRIAGSADRQEAGHQAGRDAGTADREDAAAGVRGGVGDWTLLGTRNVVVARTRPPWPITRHGREAFQSRSFRDISVGSATITRHITSCMQTVLSCVGRQTY